MKILVTGATGYIGGRLIPRLLQAGYQVRCLVRHPESLINRFGNLVEVIKGDILDPSSLACSFEGIDVAYYLIHSMASGENEFEDRDRLAARYFACAAQQAKLSRIIYLGGLGSSSQRLSPHLQSRQEVGAILRESGVPVTEFRAAIIVGSGSLSFEMIRYLAERLPIMLCPQWVHSRCQPIAIRDVLNYLLSCLQEPQSIGQILEIGGADVLTYREMMLGYARARELKRWLLEVPILTPRISSYWVHLITPIPAAMARPLIEGLKNDVICHNQKSLKIFPSIQPMSYLEAVKLAIARLEAGGLETIWSGAQSSSLREQKSFPVSLQTKEGMIMERRKTWVDAKAPDVFGIFCGIGGDRGWFYADFLWKIRGAIDRLLGGVGMRRGRRDPETLRVGDALDFWRVEDIIPHRRLRLRAEMKLPGKAWLQFEINPLDKSGTPSLLTQTAFFEPKGLSGFLYWYLLYPIHRIIFSGLCRTIREKSEDKN